MYPNLNIYSAAVDDVKLHTWWVVSQKVPHIYKQVTAVMAVLMGGQPRSMQRNFDKRLCQTCGARMVDDALHVILDCTALSCVRQQNLLKLQEAMPNSMFTCYEAMVREDKLLFLLSPLQCKYVSEWRPVYIEVASMVYALYDTRAKLYDALPGSNTSPGVISRN